jgi:hypothetical protein
MKNITKIYIWKCKREREKVRVRMRPVIYINQSNEAKWYCRTPVEVLNL